MYPAEQSYTPFFACNALRIVLRKSDPANPAGGLRRYTVPADLTQGRFREARTFDLNVYIL
ncbi:MAG: hypothetical protein DBX40_02545 [Clostridiales bacterium]|nr:MAG: hypothetical protein DBX40_02545 [Clostridiales bacterium]